MDGRRAVAAALAGAITVGVVAVSLSLGSARRQEADCLSALDAMGPLEPARAEERALPESLRGLTTDGRATLIRTRDGRRFLLGKTSIGWKGNFRGFVCGHEPPREGELRQELGRRELVFDDGPLSIELGVDGQRGRLYQVFFDLN